MLRVFLASLLIATPVLAGEEPRTMLELGSQTDVNGPSRILYTAVHEGDHLGTLTFHNEPNYGLDYNADTILLEIEPGIVIQIEWLITANVDAHHLPADIPDIFRVIRTPDGIIALPQEISVQEMDSGSIQLFWVEGVPAT